jgi:hypothetical protein
VGCSYSMLYFCTYFDSNYMLRGLALYRSLVRNAGAFRLWALCLDDRAYETLERLALPEVNLIALSNFERENSELLQVKGDRSEVEYYFTCTPFLPLYVLRSWPEIDVITYLDADLFFFSNPSAVLRELGGGSVLMVGHRFAPALMHLKMYGIYNVGFLSFRRNNVGLRCLRWWRDRCLDWCYDRVEIGRFADQKYLDDWPTRFPRVVVLRHRGGGVAPWNVENYTLRLEKGRVLVDRQPLLFFHFHGLKQIGRWVCDPNLGGYGIEHNRSVLKRHVYGPYMRELQKAASSIRASLPVVHSGLGLGSIRGECHGMGKRIKHQLSMTKKALKGNLWIVIRGRTI